MNVQCICFSCACENAGTAGCEAVGRSFQELISATFNESEGMVVQHDLFAQVTNLPVSGTLMTGVQFLPYCMDLVACGIEVYMILSSSCRIHPFFDASF